ncbi:MAG: EAL domain-containing protein, partial [Epsilonproteobacteria bacterium]|nr:EAL domain-containing protein [Campylobacterota bacterium]
IDLVKDIYEENIGAPKEIIYKKIRKKLKNIRFFDNKSGYYFIYDLKGNCILLPSKPSLEGTNQINLLDGNKEYVVQKIIKIVQSQGEGFGTWSWHKIGEKKMQKKIGFVKLFKPLNILIGSARYEEDITKIIKTEVKIYLKSLSKNEYGYIFAYDFSGNSMLDWVGRYKHINRWNDVTQGYHLIRYAIRGAKVNPEGFFMHYNLKDQKNRLSYIKLISGFDWIIGTNVQSNSSIYLNQKKQLKESLFDTLRNAIYISIVILIVFIFIFFIISLKIKKLFKKLERAVNVKTTELIEQKNVFKRLFDGASDGLALSKNKKMYDVNSAVLKIFEASSKSEFLALQNEDYFPQKQDNGQDSLKLLKSKIDIVNKEGKVDFEIQAKTLNGRKIWLNVVATKIILQLEDVGYFVFRDITSRKKIEEELEVQHQKLLFQAKHDPLTSLPNRIFLMDRLHQSIKRLKRSKKYLAVVFLDIDNFKNINDAFGHDIGDLLLIEISTILKNLLRNTDTIARFGGDEFVILLDDLNSIDYSSTIIQKIVDSFQEPFYIKNNPFDITFSIGVSVYPNDAKEEMNLLKYADMAMYRAKNSGKNRYVYYDGSMNTDILEHIQLKQEIKRGIENNEFILHYQPQFTVGSEDIVGFEALVRWQHPLYGFKFPDYFIQIAENSNLMIPLGEMISKKAMQQIASWYEEGLNPGIMSINFTAKQLESPDFFDKLQIMLDETGCRPEWIEAELIERYIMSDTEKTTNLLKCFKDIGISVAIDDFGTGYSSLGYLKYLQITKLKIDKTFVDDLVNDKKDRVITKSIIDITIGLDIEVLAEGVETKEQYDILQKLGCQIIQGYYFSKPIPSDDARTLLIKKLQEKKQLQV